MVYSRYHLPFATYTPPRFQFSFFFFARVLIVGDFHENSRHRSSKLTTITSRNTCKLPRHDVHLSLPPGNKYPQHQRL